MTSCSDDIKRDAVDLLAQAYPVITSDTDSAKKLRTELDFRMNELKKVMTPGENERSDDWTLMVEGLAARKQDTHRERSNFNHFFDRLRAENDIFIRQATMGDTLTPMELKRQIIGMIEGEIAQEQGISK